MNLNDASRRAFALLRERNETVSFAESLTGGLIAASLIGNPGSSDVIGESYVTYASAAKVRILGVRQETVDTVGVVSARCAEEMAAGVLGISGANWGVSATGLAGPGGMDNLPAGTVFIGAAGKDGVSVRECHFDGDREQVRRQAAAAALQLLAECME